MNLENKIEHLANVKEESEIRNFNFPQAGESQAHLFPVVVSRSHHYSPTLFIIVTGDAVSSSIETAILIIQM